MGGQACRGFSHVQEQTALTGSLPEQEPTQTLEVFQVCLHRKGTSFFMVFESGKTETTNVSGLKKSRKPSGALRQLLGLTDR